MSDEDLAVLDDKGKPTGKLFPRSEVHKKELWHEVVHIWVVNEENKLLLQKRSSEKEQYANVLHISSAGHVTAAESVLDTALREVREEIGLDFVPSELIFMGKFKVSQKTPETGFIDKEWVNQYLLKVEGNLAINLQKEEVKGVRWISLDKLEEEIKDDKTYKKYLNHPKGYYLKTVSLIRPHLRTEN